MPDAKLSHPMVMVHTHYRFTPYPQPALSDRQRAELAKQRQDKKGAKR